MRSCAVSFRTPRHSWTGRLIFEHSGWFPVCPLLEGRRTHCALFATTLASSYSKEGQVHTSLFIAGCSVLQISLDPESGHAPFYDEPDRFNRASWPPSSVTSWV